VAIGIESFSWTFYRIGAEAPWLDCWKNRSVERKASIDKGVAPVKHYQCRDSTPDAL